MWTKIGTGSIHSCREVAFQELRQIIRLVLALPCFSVRASKAGAREGEREREREREGEVGNGSEIE